VKDGAKVETNEGVIRPSMWQLVMTSSGLRVQREVFRMDTPFCWRKLQLARGLVLK